MAQIGAGESIRTEVSCKYDRPVLTEMLEAASLKIVEWCTDENGLYAMALVAPIRAHRFPREIYLIDNLR